MLKGAVMPEVAHHLQQLFQQGTGLRVEQVVGLAALVVFPRGSIGVLVAQIDLACGHAVAHHFAHIAQGHLHAVKARLPGAVIDPVFQMVLVAALVVQPRGGIAPRQTFRFVGAVVTLIIDAAWNELGRAVLAQVVGKALLVEPAGKSVFHHQQLVPGDGFKMALDVHAVISSTAP